MKQRILWLMVAFSAIFVMDGFAQGRTLVQLLDIKGGVAGDIAYTTTGGISAWGAPAVAGILTTTTVLGGDLSGTLPNPTVAKLRTVALSATLPTVNQILAYNGTAWTPTTPTAAQTLSFTAATNTLSLSGGGGSVVLGYGTYAATEQFYNPSGSTITLATTGLPTDLAKIHVFRPFRLWHGTGNDWTLSGQIITFTSPFAANERIVVDVFK
jgi:hypothetical protein